MNIIFTSESIGKASLNVRKVLDRYATRIGSDSWGASLTQEGLDTVKILLNRASSKKSSVACHRITQDGVRKLAWTVGNVRMFNKDGACSTGWTAKKLKKEDASLPYNVQLIIRIISIIGLLHDIGKSTVAFQDVLNHSVAGGTKIKVEDFRHEAVSAMMLGWLSKYNTDIEWINGFILAIRDSTLEKLIENSLKYELMEHRKDNENGIDFSGAGDNDCMDRPLLFGIMWLITAHHRLPKGTIQVERECAKINDDIHHRKFEGNNIDILNIEKLSANGLPWKEPRWNKRLLEELESLSRLVSDNKYMLLGNNFTDFIRLYGRPVFQIADHIISGDKEPTVTPKKNYAYANTVGENGEQKRFGQELYKHLINVSRLVSHVAQELLTFRKDMPGIDKSDLPRKLTKDSDDKRFIWQDTSSKEIRQKRGKISTNGFFGVLIAGTGSGKTIGALKIASGFNDPLRIVYASPLRSLTLQSGDQFSKLHFSKEDLATIIGDPLIQKMHDVMPSADDNLYINSKNDESLVKKITYLQNKINNENDEESLSIVGGYDIKNLVSELRLLRSLDEKCSRMVATPVLAATLDTVMKLADGRRGSYISHLLRIASSDLIIDEVDMYSPTDLLAIGRLVEAAGFWRSRIILSSATLSPIISNAFYAAYQKGFQTRNKLENLDLKITSGWFSDCNQGTVLLKTTDNASEYEKHNKIFTSEVAEIIKINGKRKIAFYISKCKTFDFNELQQSIKDLHDRKAVCTPDGRRFSFGCVQVVNVKNCQKIAIELCNKISFNSEDYDFRVVCLHGRLSLATRNFIDGQLNSMLNRKGENGNLNPLNNQFVRDFANTSKAKNLVVILVSTLETTGRDHDFDWGIIESRQERDLLQFLGRLLRHRLWLLKDGGFIDNLVVFDVPLSWKGSNTFDEKNHPYSKFGVADSIHNDIKKVRFIRENKHQTYGDMPNYECMMEKSYGVSALITPFRVISETKPDVNECKIDKITGLVDKAFTVRACETTRLHNALSLERGDKYATLIEWLSDKNRFGRLLSNHQDRFRFRSSRALNYYWRDKDDVWHYASIPGKEFNIKTSIKQKTIPQYKFKFEKLLFQFNEDEEIDEIIHNTGHFCIEARLRLSGVYVYSDTPKFQNFKYHHQIGMIE